MLSERLDLYLDSNCVALIKYRRDRYCMHCYKDNIFARDAICITHIVFIIEGRREGMCVTSSRLTDNETIYYSENI